MRSFELITLSHLQKYPDLGVVVAAINTVLYPLRWFKIFPFTNGNVLKIETLMQEVMRETGLHDFGGLEFVESYKRVAALPLYKAQALTNFGFISGRMEMKMFLTRRLQLNEYYKQHPEVLQTKLSAPVFVFGLGRYHSHFMYYL